MFAIQNNLLKGVRTFDVNNNMPGKQRRGENYGAMKRKRIIDWMKDLPSPYESTMLPTTDLSAGMQPLTSLNANIGGTL